MSETSVHEGLTPEGNETQRAALEHADWLKSHLTPESIDAAKAAGLLDDEGISLLAECQNFENYIAKDDGQRAHVDQLVESLKEFIETP